MNEFYVQLAEIMDVETVKPGDVLANFPEWDSLTVLSIIATFGTSNGVRMTAVDFRDLVTAEDLARLLANKSESTANV